MHIVRATRDLEPDTELSFWYQVPLQYESYDETQKQLSNWGFKCECTLCLAKKGMPSKSLARRKALYEDLKRAMGASHSTITAPISIGKARKVLEQLDQTYTPAERAPGAVRLECWDPYIALGKALLVSDRPNDAVEVTARGLEALGFVITANPPRKGPGSQGARPELRVKQWGLANECCVDAFLTLFRAYQVLAPELVTVAKEFVGTAYSMVVGEKDTVVDTYPELR